MARSWTIVRDELITNGHLSPERVAAARRNLAKTQRRYRLRRRALLALVVVGVAVIAVAQPARGNTPKASAGGARLTVIYFDSPGSDTGSNRSLNDEFVSIKNVTSTRRVLTGWTLRDTSGHVFRFPTFNLPAGVTVRVHTGRGSDTPHNLYWGSRAYVWTNTGDTATLRNAVGTRVDSCRYTSASDPERTC